MNDTLDDLLHEHGRQWAQAQAAPPPLDDAISTAIAPRDRHRWVAIAAAVAGVAAAAAIPVAMSGSGATHRSATSSTATKPAAASGSVVAPPSEPDAVIQRLNVQALALARQEGDPDATGQAVRTTWAEAVGAHPDWSVIPGPPGSTDVWVIEIRGTFACTCAPDGTRTALGITLDANTYQDYAVSLARAPYDLSALGDVIELPMSQ